MELVKKLDDSPPNQEENQHKEIPKFEDNLQRREALTNKEDFHLNQDPSSEGEPPIKKRVDQKKQRQNGIELE